MSTEHLISLDEALAAVLSLVHPVEAERTGVINTPGRTLAEDVLESDGSMLIEQGTVIGGAEMGVLAQAGRSGVLIYRRPRVSIVTTGDEFVDLMETVNPGKFRNVNRYSLAGRVFSSGCEVGKLPHAGDSTESVRRALHAARTSDLVIVSCGALEDKPNCIGEALKDSADTIFEGVAIDPGAKTTLAAMSGRPVFVLPGDPAAALIAFEVLVRPALMAMLGRPAVCHPSARVVVVGSAGWGWDRRGFLPAVASFDSGRLVAGILEPSSVHAMARANCLVVIPEGVESVTAGEEVDALLLRLPI